MDIDWNTLIAKRFLDEAPVRIRVRPPKIFTEGRTGTHIEVRELRPPTWTRREVRSLCSQITSICSPFEGAGEFRAVLQVPGHEHWIEDLPDFAAILDRAMWRFRFRLDEALLDCTYEFRPAPGFNLQPRIVTKTGGPLQIPPTATGGRMDRKVVAHRGVSRSDPGLIRLARWIRNRRTSQPRSRLRDSEILERAAGWMPQWFRGVSVDSGTLRLHRRAGEMMTVPQPEQSERIPESTDQAEEALTSGSPRRRLRALQRLSRAGDPDLADWCALLLGDDDRMVRQQGAGADRPLRGWRPAPAAAVRPM